MCTKINFYIFSIERDSPDVLVVVNAENGTIETIKFKSFYWYSTILRKRHTDVPEKN